MSYSLRRNPLQISVVSPTVQIGILKTDTVRPELSRTYGEYPDMFAALLSQTDPRLRFRTYDVVQGEYPDSTQAHDAFLITGSRVSVYDDLAWIGGLETFVRQLAQVGKPLVGVCFGHQLIARAMGGCVAKSSRGWGVGALSWRLLGGSDWLPDDETEFRLFASHRDQVESLPPSARLLASSDFCPIAMYQVGANLIGIQGHPEFSAGYARGLYDLRRELLGEARYAAAISSLDKPTDELKVARWIVSFICQGRVS